MNTSTKNFVFSLVVAVFTLALVTIILAVGFHLLEDRLTPQIAALIAAQLPDEEKRAYYDRILGADGSMWDTVPEHKVGRIGQTGKTLEHKGTEVHFNNAGMRSTSPFRKKDSESYRIVCLGDSFVFGTGGLERDRFCDLIGDYYESQNITVGGRQIETLALGLGSWTMIQGATYLSSRLSAYEPDLIIVLTTSNDVTVSSGVTGKGVYTQKFSPESRAHGSGLFSLEAPLQLGFGVNNLIAEDLSPISARMWHNAMASIKNLAQLQSRRGGRIAFSVLQRNPRFRNMFLRQFYNAKIDAPAFSTSYFRSFETKLRHDDHPNRKGHEIISSHMINIFDRLGWIPVDSPPSLDDRLSLSTNREVSNSEITNAKRQMAESYLHGELDFLNLNANSVRGIMGGMFSGRLDGKRVTWASVRSAFLLRTVDEADSLQLNIEIPDRVELTPLPLHVQVNGGPVYSGELPAGEHILDISFPEPTSPFGVVEIILETPRYFTEISDHRMKSYVIVRATLQ